MYIGLIRRPQTYCAEQGQFPVYTYIIYGQIYVVLSFTIMLITGCATSRSRLTAWTKLLDVDNIRLRGACACTLATYSIMFTNKYKSPIRRFLFFLDKTFECHPNLADLFGALIGLCVCINIIFVSTQQNFYFAH